jgi:hypothetical protein
MNKQARIVHGSFNKGIGTAAATANVMNTRATVDALGER